MVREKYIIATLYIASITTIFFGILSLFLGYKGILAFNLENILNGLIFILFGIIILVFLIKSENIRHDWINGSVLYTFYIAFFSMIIIHNIILTIFLPTTGNFFIIIFSTICIFICYKIIHKLIGCFIKFHSISPKIIIEKIGDLLNSKKFEYVKKGSQKTSINNLSCLERIYIPKLDIKMDISSKGIIVGPVNSSNEKDTYPLLDATNKIVDELNYMIKSKNINTMEKFSQYWSSSTLAQKSAIISLIGLAILFLMTIVVLVWNYFLPSQHIIEGWPALIIIILFFVSILMFFGGLIIFFIALLSRR